MGNRAKLEFLICLVVPMNWSAKCPLIQTSIQPYNKYLTWLADHLDVGREAVDATLCEFYLVSSRKQKSMASDWIDQVWLDSTWIVLYTILCEQYCMLSVPGPSPVLPSNSNKKVIGWKRARGSQARRACRSFKTKNWREQERELNCILMMEVVF